MDCRLNSKPPNAAKLRQMADFMRSQHRPTICASTYIILAERSMAKSMVGSSLERSEADILLGLLDNAVFHWNIGGVF